MASSVLQRNQAQQISKQCMHDLLEGIYCKANRAALTVFPYAAGTDIASSKTATRTLLVDATWILEFKC